MSTHTSPPTTPLMRQYHALKEQHPDKLLLFQVGDFFELFFEDAKKAAAFLGIALTARGKDAGEPIPLCGVPMHALDHYLVKLVRGGFKVALCEQLEEATPGKVVQRGITQVFTPGTLTDSRLLDDKSASYILSFFPAKEGWGLLFGELLTAQLFATVLPQASDKLLEAEIARFLPDEIILPQTVQGTAFQSYFGKLGYFTTLADFDVQSVENVSAAQRWLHTQFTPQGLMPVSSHDPLRLALYTFYGYMRATHQQALEQFKSLHFYQPEDFLILDAATQRNLEIVHNNQDGGRKNTVVSVLDRAVTPMGSRMIKKWLLRPLVKQEAIEQRLDVVGWLVNDVSLSQQLREAFEQVGDTERVVGRLALNRAQLNDYRALLRTLEVVPHLRDLLAQMSHLSLVMRLLERIPEVVPLAQLLVAAINQDAGKDWIINQGFDQELDEVRALVACAHDKILALEAAEQAATGIGSLKIRYNNVQGYYVEVTKTHLDAIPDSYVRQQTLVGKERYMIPALRELQHDIMTARSRIESLEREVFERVKRDVLTYLAQLRNLTQALAHADALLSLSLVAYDNGYVRPRFNADRNIVIHEGRHMVVERKLDQRFVPNDTLLTDEQSLWIITGPNMGGKSTYLRQVALIALTAQCGSFVPAREADLSLCDRIFTRIGASDNVADGKSTFLVEMEETSLICSQATERSLVILDEVGRGTSTYDGLAIAQAVVEHLFDKVGARCLFATHYHELTTLAQRYRGIVCYHAASTRERGAMVFLHRIMPGVAEGSFGLEVAKLADLPAPVISRAGVILQGLQEADQVSGVPVVPGAVTPAVRMQRDEAEQLREQLADAQEKLARAEQALQQLRDIDHHHLSPKQAFDLVWKIKEEGL